ncbi:MAG: dihydropteroate synthase [Bacteroidetes bacterium HGW-Bacteroidetes-1]|nr:MAG: dihydropteroate synthase [Bacteroidetes bacterium HGW-Bacteroidetes-1]
MGILNLTPDSFYTRSRVIDAEYLTSTAGRMLDEGADFLDLGGVSTRPGAENVSTNDEIKRLLPAIKTLLKAFPEAFISIDTYRKAVAEIMLNEGAFIINDISGGKFDQDMPDFIGKYNVPYVMMHIHRNPSEMQKLPLDTEVLSEVKLFFEKQSEIFEMKGANQLILDPGFGFGKTLSANYRLLANLNELRVKDYPLLIGISRKSMIYKPLDIDPEKALNGTSVLNTIALLKGANILRVHDVKEARETVDLCSLFLINTTF